MNAPAFVTPAVLSGQVRNVIVARAWAGSINAETTAQTLRACRAAARQRLGRARLSSAQAAEVDALALQTRGNAEGGGASCNTPQGQAMAAAPLAANDTATDGAVLAMLARIERLLVALVALLTRHLARGEQALQRPVVLAEGERPQLEEAAPESTRRLAGSNVVALARRSAS